MLCAAFGVSGVFAAGLTTAALFAVAGIADLLVPLQDPETPTDRRHFESPVISTSYGPRVFRPAVLGRKP
jgi:hypothetical protein